MEDLDCISIIQTKHVGPEVDDAISELVDRHSGIYIQISKQYVPESCDFFHSQEDVRREIPTFIWNVAKDFDPQKGCKFSSYLGERARWYFCNSIKKREDISNVSYDDSFWDSYQAPSSDADIEEKDLLSSIMKKISTIEDPRAKQIFHLRYVEGTKNKTMSWHKISEITGISHQGCIDIHERYIKELKESLKNEEKFLTFV